MSIAPILVEILKAHLSETGTGPVSTADPVVRSEPPQPSPGAGGTSTNPKETP
jgi:hypothetical protein